jgi:hypothetical protein
MLWSIAKEIFFGKFNKIDFNTQIRNHGLKSNNQFHPYILIQNCSSLDMWKTLFVKHGSTIESCLLAGLLIAYKESVKRLYINEFIGGEEDGLLERLHQNRSGNQLNVQWESILMYL